MENRIYLRALELEDYKTSIAWRMDDEIWSMLGGPKYFVSEEYEKRWVEKVIFDSHEIRLAVCEKDSEKYIGNVYMTDIDMINRTCQSHILIGDKDYWGKGYAREALMLAVDYMFNERNIRRIQANILETNIASLKMHQKCGYEIEGILRNAVYKNGRYINQYVLGLLKEE